MSSKIVCMKLKTAIKIYSTEYTLKMVIGVISSGLKLHHRSKPSPNFVFYTLSKACFSLDKNYGFLRHLHFLLIPITKSSGWGSFQYHFQKEAKFLIPSCLRNFENRTKEPQWAGCW